MADCVNSSPPLILRKFQGFGGIWANSGKFGKFRENSGELGGIQWGFVWRLEFSGNSWGISGQRRLFGENFGFGMVSGDLGGQKAFAQIASSLAGRLGDLLTPLREVFSKHWLHFAGQTLRICDAV